MVQGEARSGIALPAVIVGILAVSASAIFIRLADAPALSVAFWRCALGVAVLAPFALSQREKLPRGRPMWLLVLSGVMLGAHFGFWISSLSYTSVAASVVLVCIAPVFVAILAFLVLGERTSPLSVFGILIAIVGCVFIATDGSAGSSALLGNVLAVLGAITVAAHLLIGRASRTSGTGVLNYSVIAYSAAGLALLPAVLISGAPLWGFSGTTWFWLAVITIGPQILGHTVLNWALRYVEATIISGSVLAEPVIAALLAWLILSEKPGVATAVGGVVVLLGLTFLLRGNRRVEELPG